MTPAELAVRVRLALSVAEMRGALMRGNIAVIAYPDLLLAYVAGAIPGEDVFTHDGETCVAAWPMFPLDAVYKYHRQNMTLTPPALPAP